MQRVCLRRLRSALRRVKRSRPSKPSIGLSVGSSWHAKGTRTKVFSNTLTRGTTTTGINSLPLAVRVSRRRGYSGTEGYGIAMRQGLVGVEHKSQSLDLCQPIVDFIPMRRVCQQTPLKWHLRPRVETISGNGQPLAAESSSNLVYRLALTLHDTSNVTHAKPTDKPRRKAG